MRNRLVLALSRAHCAICNSGRRKMSFGVRKAPTGCNFVHNDEIWKDHVRRELQTSRRWPDKWGFLSQMDRQREVCSEDQGKRNSSLKLPTIKKERKTTEDVSSLVTLFDHALRGRGKTRDYPRTTASEIGWKSADFSALERFGRHARGQQGIRHLLDWPREAVY